MEPLAALPNLPHFRANKARPRGRGGDFEFTDGTHFFEQVTLLRSSCTYIHYSTQRTYSHYIDNRAYDHDGHTLHRGCGSGPLQAPCVCHEDGSSCTLKKLSTGRFGCG